MRKKNYVLEVKKRIDESQEADLADQERWVPGRWWESSEAQADSTPLKAQQWAEPVSSNNGLERD